MGTEQASPLTQDESQDLVMKAGVAFRPRSPIDQREFFAGRWEQLTALADSIFQTGLHIIIFGERGVGKTSLANIIEALVSVMEEDLGGGPPEPRIVIKVNVHSQDEFGDAWRRSFDEIAWIDRKLLPGFVPEVEEQQVTIRDTFGISDSPSIDEVRGTLRSLKRSIFVFDEFDRAGPDVRRTFTDLIKALSDYAIDSTIVLVGVSDTIDELVRDHESIVRAIVQIQLPRMTGRELRDILKKASDALAITVSDDAASLIVRVSQGLPHYTHLIGLHATREAAKRLSRTVELSDVHKSCETAVEQSLQSIRETHLRAIRSAHKDALYGRVLLACAAASSAERDPVGYFHPSDVISPLSEILNRDNVVIATFQKHINEFCEVGRGKVLERSGAPRAYKYRFPDPLLPPLIFMTAISSGSITPSQLHEITKTD